MNIRKCVPLVALSLGTALLPLSAVDLTFDAQSFDIISGSGTTAPGAIPWNALDAAPAGFSTFSAVSSTSITNSGITASITGLIGVWSGNSAFVVSQNPLPNDYFIVATGTTATLTLSGLTPGSEYLVRIYHGRAEPQQLRQLTLSLGGQTIGAIDNRSAGGSGNVRSFKTEADSSGQIVVSLLAAGAEGDFAGFDLELQVQTWGGVVVPEDGIVETDTYYGALYVKEAPWVYSYALDTWIYTEEETLGTSGSWVYVP